MTSVRSPFLAVLQKEPLYWVNITQWSVCVCADEAADSH